MQRIAICDDEKKILLELEETTDIFFKGYCVDCKIQTYQSSENLWYDLQDGIYYDLFLLDIEMPQVSGMDLAGRIRDASPAAKIIFITSHMEYAITAYEFSVFRYITKTQIEEKLSLALRDFYKLFCLERDEYYTIEIKNHVERLPYREILYVLKEGKYAVFSYALGASILYCGRFSEYLFASTGFIAALTLVDTAALAALGWAGMGDAVAGILSGQGGSRMLFITVVKLFETGIVLLICRGLGRAVYRLRMSGGYAAMLACLLMGGAGGIYLVTQAKSLVGIGLNLFQMLSGFSLILVVCTLYFFLRVQETRREQEYTAR